MTWLRPHSTVSTALALLAALTLATPTLASCSRETQQERTCDQVDGVRSAVEQLRNVNLGENGMAALDSGLAQVKSELELLRASLSTELRPPAEAVADSVDALRASVAAARGNPTTAALETVSTDLHHLRETAGDLRSAVTEIC